MHYAEALNRSTGYINSLLGLCLILIALFLPFHSTVNMRYFGSLLFTLPLLSLSKALVLRATDDFNLTMSVVPEAIQGMYYPTHSRLSFDATSIGGNLQLEIKGPGPSFFKYMATLTHPNGTEQPLLDYTNFELNNSLSDNPTLPTNRTCMPRTPIGYDIQVNNLTLSDVGTWKVTLDAVFYYGSNGYEYNDPLGGNVCISPPFTGKYSSY